MKKKPAKKPQSTKKRTKPVLNVLNPLHPLNKPRTSLSTYKKERTRPESKEDWNPNPFEIEYHPPTNNDDPDRFMVTVRFDLRIRLKSLQKAIAQTHHFYRKEVLIESRKQRYKQEELNEVRMLKDKGLSGEQIWKYKYPQFKSYDLQRDCLSKPGDEIFEGEKIRYKSEEDKKAWRLYRRTLRLIEKVSQRR